LSLSSACFVFPNTLNADETFLVCCAFKPSQTSLASASIKDGKSGLDACRAMMDSEICLESLAKSSLVFGLDVKMSDGTPVGVLAPEAAKSAPEGFGAVFEAGDPRGGGDDFGRAGEASTAPTVVERSGTKQLVGVLEIRGDLPLSCQTSSLLFRHLRHEIVIIVPIQSLTRR
jgi:hypothetical protein